MSVSVHANTSDVVPSEFFLIDLMLEVALSPPTLLSAFPSWFPGEKKPSTVVL